MDVFDVDQLRKALRSASAAYREFLRTPSMSVGLYRLTAGSVDPQGPHGEDEVYVVIEGRATLDVEGRSTAVMPGSVAFVAAGAGHRFRDIEEDLVTVVLFAPPESGGEAVEEEE
jgi:mannose-6-phosphate isomerase-like protein (cupin superfamily)